MFALLGLVIGALIAFAVHPTISQELGRYVAMAVVAALDASLGGVRAYLEHTFNDRIFVVAFAANALVAIAIVWVGDQLGVDLVTAVVVVFGVRIFQNVAALRRRVFGGYAVTATTAPSGDEVSPGASATTRRLGSLLLVLGVTGLVGFLLVGQLRGSEAFRQRLQAENEGDLTRILAGLTTEADALRDEISTLKLQLVQLQNTQQEDSAAAAAAAAQLRALQVLAGTVPVNGPGLTMRIADPEGGVAYDTLIDVVAELRDAGAEALAINGRRIGAASAFGENADRITIDGISISAPYTVVAIGPAATLEGGLKIPGGALDVLASLRGVDVDLQRSAKLDVPALANPPKFRVGKAG